MNWTAVVVGDVGENTELAVGRLLITRRPEVVDANDADRVPPEPTVTDRDALVLRSSTSVSVRTAVKIDCVAYACVAVGPLPVAPSPKSQL